MDIAFVLTRLALIVIVVFFMRNSVLKIKSRNMTGYENVLYWQFMFFLGLIIFFK